MLAAARLGNLARTIMNREDNLNVGDTIKCHDADEAISLMQELAKEGIETDFIYYDGDGIGLEVVRT